MFEAREPKEDNFFSDTKIRTPGFYIVGIVKSWEHKSETGSIGIKIDFITGQGQTISHYINTIKKNGDSNDIGCDAIQEVIMPLLGIKGGLREKQNDSIFLPQWKEDDIEIKATSYPQMEGKEIGIIVGYDGAYNGRPTLRIDSFYHPETRQTAYEYTKGIAASICEKRLEKIMAKGSEQQELEKKAEVNGATATYMQSDSSFADDIPF